MGNIKDAAVVQMRALKRSGKALSYAWLRRMFAVQKNAEVYKSLNFGKAIIESEDQLNQYLYSYGPMVQSQWQHAGKFLSLKDLGPAARWIDYGCGQGLAGLFLFEALGSKLFDQVSSVILVEPSAPALERAEAVYSCIAPHSAITTVNKSFDELISGELEVKETYNTVHIFSNVLDINGYNHLKLLGDRLSKGSHVILAVGNDRDFDGGSPNIKKLKAAVEHPKMTSQITVKASSLQPFKCENRGEPAIVWYCRLEVCGA